MTRDEIIKAAEKIAEWLDKDGLPISADNIRSLIVLVPKEGEWK